MQNIKINTLVSAEESNVLAYKLWKRVVFEGIPYLEDRLKESYPSLYASLQSYFSIGGDFSITSLDAEIRANRFDIVALRKYVDGVVCGISYVPYTVKDIETICTEARGRVKNVDEGVAVQGRDGVYRTYRRTVKVSFAEAAKAVRLLLNVGAELMPCIPTFEYVTIAVRCSPALYSSFLSAIPLAIWEIQDSKLIVNILTTYLNRVSVPYAVVNKRMVSPSITLGLSNLCCALRAQLGDMCSCLICEPGSPCDYSSPFELVSCAHGRCPKRSMFTVGSFRALYDLEHESQNVLSFVYSLRMRGVVSPLTLVPSQSYYDCGGKCLESKVALKQTQEELEIIEINSNWKYCLSMLEDHGYVSIKKLAERSGPFFRLDTFCAYVARYPDWFFTFDEPGKPMQVCLTPEGRRYFSSDTFRDLNSTTDLVGDKVLICQDRVPSEVSQLSKFILLQKMKLEGVPCPCDGDDISCSWSDESCDHVDCSCQFRVCGKTSQDPDFLVVGPRQFVKMVALFRIHHEMGVVRFPFVTSQSDLRALQRIVRSTVSIPSGMKTLFRKRNLLQNFSLEFSNPHCYHENCVCSITLRGKGPFLGKVFTSAGKPISVQYIDLVCQFYSFYMDVSEVKPVQDRVQEGFQDVLDYDSSWF